MVRVSIGPNSVPPSAAEDDHRIKIPRCDTTSGDSCATSEEEPIEYSDFTRLYKFIHVRTTEFFEFPKTL